MKKAYESPGAILLAFAVGLMSSFFVITLSHESWENLQSCFRQGWVLDTTGGLGIALALALFFLRDDMVYTPHAWSVWLAWASSVTGYGWVWSEGGANFWGGVALLLGGMLATKVSERLQRPGITSGSVLCSAVFAAGVIASAVGLALFAATLLPGGDVSHQVLVGFAALGAVTFLVPRMAVIFKTAYVEPPESLLLATTSP